MAKYLLDIHTFLWWYKNALQLFKKVKDTLINPQNDFFISISSFWEIVIKQNAGKLKLTCELDNFVIACKKQNIQIAPIRLHHLKPLVWLPFLHLYSFDWLMNATALSDYLTFFSKYDIVSQYGLDVILVS